MNLAIKVISAAAVASAGCEAARAADPSRVLWTVQTSDRYPPSVAPAPNQGAYVTTTRGGGAVGVLTHYSNTGAQIWRKEQGGSGDLWHGENVGSDDLGNAYMAGYRNNANVNGGSDVFLQKFSSDGSLLWTQQFGTPQTDWPAGLAISSKGTSYITSGGWASNYGISPPGSYTTVRQYLPDGSPGWITELNTGDGTYPGSTPMGCEGTAIDYEGNIISSFSNYTRVGNTISTFNYLAKTNATGTVQWIKKLTGGGGYFGVAVGGSNDIYLASGPLYKYDPAGNLSWVTSNRSGQVTFGVNAVCVGPDGTVYAAGGASGDDGYVTAFDPNGLQLWSRSIDPPAGTANLYFEGIALSGNDLIVTGQLFGAIPNNPNGLALSGNLIVAFKIPEPPTFVLALAATFAIAIRQGFSERAKASLKTRPKRQM